MFSFMKKESLRKVYDELLLKEINQAKIEWDRIKQTNQAIISDNSHIEDEIILARIKYELLFKEARRRKLKGHIQISFFNE